MPKVSSYELRIPNVEASGYVKTVITVNFNPEGKYFYIEPPDYIADMMKDRCHQIWIRGKYKKIIQSDTFDDVKRMLRCLLNDFEKKTKDSKKEKYIRIQLDLRGVIERKGRVVFEVRDNWSKHSDYPIMGFDYSIGYMINNKEFYDLDMEYVSNVNDGDDFIYLSYTKEREDFFKGIKHSFEEVILKLNKFLGSKSKVLNAIKNRTKLLELK